MSDPNLITPPPLAVPPPANRKLKIALAVSVAINLAVAGLVGGIALHGGPEARGAMMVRDFGFGQFDGALRPEDRTALRTAIQGRLGDIRAARQQMQADGEAILNALRAEPFVQDTLSSVLDAQTAHLEDRLKFGNSVIKDFLLAMSPEARQAFAERLEHRMGHRGKDDDKD